MIGFFVFDDVPSVDNPLVLAHASLNNGIQGLFYVRESDCKDISSVTIGSEFFGVLDDSSGFGACLFIKGLDVEADSMLLQQNLHVKGNAEVDGHLKVSGEITGKSTVTKLTITAKDITTLASQITSMPGPCGLAVLENVTLELENG